jgi:hypothetical protein
MAAFCASGAHVHKVRCAPVLEFRHFRFGLSPNLDAINGA